jgi:BTB And C-terminal Kelch
LQTITERTTEALASQGWLNVGLKTVQEFLKMDDLDIDEVDLVRELVKWGENQMQKNPEQAENLRAKILPALHLIRFVGMSQEEVAKVCMEELAGGDGR